MMNENENLDLPVSDCESRSEENPFSSDDSMKDHNYASDGSSSGSADIHGIRLMVELLQNEADDTIKKKTTRKRKTNPAEWKRNRTKFIRNSGKAYRTL